MHQRNSTHDIFNDGIERLLAGDMSGLNDIEPDMHDTVLEMTDLARAAGWLGTEPTPSARNAVSANEGEQTENDRLAPSALNGHVPWRTANRATGPREVTMQATAIPATPPISHRTRERSKPAITPATRFPYPSIANAAIVVLLVLAGFGSWRVFEGGMIGGGDGPVPAVRHHAQAPIATAMPDNAPVACDFSDETPIYNGVDAPPVDGTVLYVTTSNELMIHCEEEPEDFLLASDVDSASPTGWPGVLAIAIGAGDYSPTPMLLNVLTNERVEFGFSDPAMIQSREVGFTGTSPFIATAMADEPSIWTLTDQRSMESRTLSDVGGVEWPQNSAISISDSGSQGTYAIAVHNAYFVTRDEPALAQPETFPGEILVVSNSLYDVTWIDIPPDLRSPFSFEVSPDGEHVAVLGMESLTDPGSATIGIFRASDGAEVTRSEPFEYEDPPTFTWVEDGDALVFLETKAGAVMRLPAQSDAAPEAVFETTGYLFDMRSAHDSTVVTVLEADIREGAREDRSERVHAIDTRTGTTSTIEGRVWLPRAIIGPGFTNRPAIIVMGQNSNGQALTHVIAPSTGMNLIDVQGTPSAASFGAPEDTGTWPPDTQATSLDRGTTVFTMRDHGNLVVADVSHETPHARSISFPTFTPPDEEWSAQARLSPDGSSLQLSVYTNQVHMQWVLDLSTPDATWIEIPQGVWLEFMPAVP